MKVEGWQGVLYDYLERSQSLMFAWGENDCCLWVARFVDAVTGSEHARESEGQYNTEGGAYAYLESKGFFKTSDIADAYLMKKPIQKAGRGDLVMIEGGALGICDGRRSYFFVENKGLTALLTLKCLRAWEV